MGGNIVSSSAFAIQSVRIPPLLDENDGWAKFYKNLKSIIFLDELRRVFIAKGRLN